MISLVIYFLDPSPPSSACTVTDGSGSVSASSLSSFSSQLWWEVLMAIQAVPRFATRMIAGGMTFYVGMCVGYVGLVHLGWFDPESKDRRDDGR